MNEPSSQSASRRPAPLAGAGVLMAMAAMAGGCGSPPPPAPTGGRVMLAAEQARAYPEAAGGLFLSLADFEDAPGGNRGYQQARMFSIDPQAGAPPQFVVNITRTGLGALSARLQGSQELVFRLPGPQDVRTCSLLSLAVYVQSLRDDLRVTLRDGRGNEWTAPTTVLRPGWNTVSVDLRRLAGAEDFNARQVCQIRLSFAEALDPVDVGLDDVLLVNNARRLEPSPPGLTVRKTGLDYRIELPHLAGALHLEQCPDGLWRLREHRQTVQVLASASPADDDREHLEALGPRRVGTAEVLEHNRQRIRIASTWHFPDRAGEWASLDMIRHLRWEWTFYPDGRWITHVEFSNPSGRRIRSVRLLLDGPAAWADTRAVADQRYEPLGSTALRWDCLRCTGGDDRARLEQYLHPGRLRLRLADEDAFAAGDGERDRFDESQGCYFAAGRDGQCRLTLEPPDGGVDRPAFRVAGPWPAGTVVSSEGLALRDTEILRDGSILFRLPGRVDHPTDIEVHAPQGPND